MNEVYWKGKDLGSLLYLFIEKLKECIYFDYRDKDILFTDNKANLIKKDLIKELNCLMVFNQWSKSTSRKIIDYINNHISSGQKWFNTVFMTGVTGIHVKNLTGFNDDERSHMGDHVPDHNTVIEKRVKVWKNVLLDDYELDKKDIYRIDQEYDIGCWYLTRPTGLTWGDILIGVLLIKGSKSDWNYELMVDIKAEIKDSVLKMTVKFDHGS